MQNVFRIALLISVLGLLSGCGSEPPIAPPQPPAADPMEHEGPGATLTPSSQVPSVPPEQTKAALAVLQVINGTIKRDESGRAVELNLAGRRWADESQVTQILDAFPEVRSLTLEGRKLTDALAPKLASLENLETLALRETAIGDGTLVLLAKTPKLKILDIRVGANLSDAGIDALAGMETIRAVRFIGCELTDEQLTTLIEGLPNLSELDLRSSRGFGVVAMEKIRSKASLRTLKLGGPEVNNDRVGPIASMTGLTSLSLEETDVDDDGLAVLADLPLKSLVLSGSLFVTDAGLALLKSCTDLQTLDLRDTGATLAVIGLLPRPDRLVSLDLSQSGVGDENVEELPRLTNLKTLALRSNQLTDAAVEWLSKMTWLEHLAVGQTAITEEGLTQLRKALPNCRIESQ